MGIGLQRRRWIQSLVTLACVVTLAAAGASAAAARAAGVRDAAAVNSQLAGIPQHGITLGRADAPVTLVWFGELQCPICADFHAKVFSTLIDRYVRTGKVRLVYRNLAFIGPDSTKAAQLAAAAGLQNREWNFISLFYDNQKTENSGYVTTGFLESIAAGAGLNVTRAFADRHSASVSKQLAAASHATRVLPEVATPSFLLGRTGSKLRYVSFGSFTPVAFSEPIDKLLAHG